MFRGRTDLGNTELGKVLWQLSIPQFPELVLVAIGLPLSFSFSHCASLCLSQTYVLLYLSNFG